MASEARPRSPLEGARRRRERENNRSGYVTLGAVRYSVRRAGVPARAGAGTCPCRCCSEELVAACLPRAKPERRTLERLRGRLGRGRDERPSRHQRLQALTERLMPRAPAPPPSPPPHSAPVLPPVPPPRSRHRHSPPRGVSVDRCDDFDADNITLVRVEPRSIVGSYAQKTIPYRSASFSQGDFAQDKYYRVRQPSIFDFGKRTNKTEAGRAGSVPIRRDGESSHDENATEGGSVASVDSAVGSDEGLLAHASPAPRSQPPGAPDALHKLGGRSLTHPLPRRAPPLRAGAAEGGSLPALGRVLQELREESDGSQADSAQPHSEGASPLEPTQPFAFPPLPAPPNACANLNCECSSFPTESEELAISIESSIPVPVYECIVKQWSQELLPQEDPTRDNVSDGSLDRDKEDETITSEQVANLLAAVQSTGSAPVPLSPTPVLATAGVRERRRPSDKSKRRKGIYITTASDDGGEEEPPAVNGCQRESSDASLQEMRLSAEARTSSLLGDKSDDSCTNGPPSPCEVQTLMWPRSEELRARRARFSQQSSDERDDESYRTRRKYGVTSRGDSPSEAESDTYSRDRTASPSPFSPSDTSDVEAKRQQFSRSNFGRTLEAPAIKSAEVGRRSLSDATVPNRKSSAGTPSAPGGEGARARGPTHVRATSSPSKLAGARGAGADLLQELLRGSSEALSNAAHFDNVVLTLGEHNDTRTHVVVELYETEKSYVDSLDILVKKYLQPLKSPENAGLLEASVVDEIFFQVPAILAVHRAFLEQLRRRLETWDLTQKVGDVFLEVFTKPAVMETYMSFINNLKRAKSTAKAAAAARPAFARFLDARARDHKGKLSLDNLLIKPVQKFPSYKLLVERLIKNTEPSHPDHKYLVEAKKEVLQLLELINCTERESLELEQQLQTLRDLEQLIEGLSGLARPERALLRLEAVQMAGAGGGARERALFLLSDTLLVTSVKRRTTTIKKPIPTYQSSIASQMEGNKYKLLMRIPLADLEIVKAKDENVRRMMCEVEALSADVGTLRRVTEQLRALHAPLPALEDAARDALHAAARLYLMMCEVRRCRGRGHAAARAEQLRALHAPLPALEDAARDALHAAARLYLMMCEVRRCRGRGHAAARAEQLRALHAPLPALEDAARDALHAAARLYLMMCEVRRCRGRGHAAARAEQLRALHAPLPALEDAARDALHAAARLYLMMCEVRRCRGRGHAAARAEQLRALHAPLPALEDAARDALHAAARLYLMMCEVRRCRGRGHAAARAEQLRALHAPLPALEDAARDALHAAARSLADRQAADAQLCQLELSVSTQNGPENLTIIFPKTEKRTSWEELLNETKQKLSSAGGAARAAQFVSPVPVRKTRAGLQFTCAAPTRPAPGQPPDVWVCNSDGYVGQVCVLSLQPRPQVASCTGVCNARILCVASVPAPAHTAPSTSSLNSVGSAKPGISVSDPDDSCQNIRLDSSSSSDEDDDASSTSEPPEPATPAPAPAPPAPALAPAPAPPAPNHSKSLSSPHTGPAAHAAAHPVMKSNSNPAVDKQAMGITSGTLSSPASRQSSEDGGAASGAASGAAGGAAGGAGAQATMWLGTEDGCVHVYNCQDNIRVKKNKIKLQHSAAVHAIVYLEEKVFVALGNGDLVVYGRDLDGSWSERARVGVGVGGAAGGAGGGALLPCGGRLWCAAASCIKIVSPHTLQVEETFQISSESKPISHMAVGGGALWLALRHAPLLRCFALARRELRADVNITAAVARMLRGCDDIIRQHKAACLRVTALLALRGALWVGTSAGVLLTAALPAPGAAPQLVGVTYGHTGHVRFLTVVENPVPQREPPKTQTLKTKALHRRSGADKPPEPAPGVETLVISGGDGYEDFRSAASSEDAGREDSTNHLLLWRV